MFDIHSQRIVCVLGLELDCLTIIFRHAGFAGKKKAAGGEKSGHRAKSL